MGPHDIVPTFGERGLTARAGAPVARSKVATILTNADPASPEVDPSWLAPWRSIIGFDDTDQLAGVSVDKPDADAVTNIVCGLVGAGTNYPPNLN